MKFRAIKAFRIDGATYGRNADVVLSPSAAKDLLKRGLIAAAESEAAADVAQPKAALANHRRKAKDE